MAEKKTTVTPPSLWLWNGIGFRLCGRRDYDPRTDSFVSLHCFCLCYLPLFALGAYRVSEAGEGWNFLSREPLSLTAKIGNLLIVAGLVTVIVFGFVHAPSGPVTPIPTSPGERENATGPSREPAKNGNPPSISETEAQTLEAEAADLLGTMLVELLGTEFDLDVLAAQGHPFQLLGMAYDDEASQQQFVARLQGHRLYADVIARFERLLRSPSRQRGAASMLYMLYALARDQVALERLVNQLPPGGFAVAAPQDQLPAYRAAVQGNAALLTQARQSQKKKTAAVVLKELAALQMLLHLCGEPVKPDDILAWAEEAARTAPSVATRDVLLDAVLLRVHLRLLQRDKEYAALATPLARSLAPRHIIPLALTRLPGLAASLKDDADLQRAVTLLKDHARRFPHSLSPAGWALLKAVDPATATTWAQELQKDALGRTDRQLRLVLDPWSTTSIMNAYWGLLLEGKEADATALLHRYAEQGVVLPK